MNRLLRTADLALRRSLNVVLVLSAAYLIPAYVIWQIVTWFRPDFMHVTLLALSTYGLYAFNAACRNTGSTVHALLQPIRADLGGRP